MTATATATVTNKHCYPTVVAIATNTTGKRRLCTNFDAKYLANPILEKYKGISRSLQEEISQMIGKLWKQGGPSTVTNGTGAEATNVQMHAKNFLNTTEADATT